ncbi:hypothetical protein TSUD_388920 [Trifolium subterraneum]|uniref:Zinc finger ZPR1-type domain-containing protein n=1 Tax=Trifolium subterraneum TaxID=3900 RepID=A0A2Z6MYD9_TRISU|nr:hypothetical protein TSUD_388920 [Trifolium subterraneum]
MVEALFGAPLSNFEILQSFESLCMHCGENGTTNSFITSIPHFKKIWLSAFDCPHCCNKNNEVMYVDEIPMRCCSYTLKISSGNPEMLNRQVVKSEHATIKIPELDFEIQSEARRGSLSTVEGILMRAADELQERCKVPQNAQYASILALRHEPPSTRTALITVSCEPVAQENHHLHLFWTILLEIALLKTLTQIGGTPDEALAGVSNQVKGEPHGSVGATAGHRAIAQSNSAEIAEALFRYSTPEEVMTFPTTCYAGCAGGCETRMFEIDIPYFKKGIIMAFTCDVCGYRNSELKAGGGFAEKGKKMTLHVKNVNDLNRLERVHGFTFGDSLDEHSRSKWLDFGARLNKLLSLEKPWTLILDDALANSFIAPATDDLKDDKQLMFEEYERTWEQDEELGLHDMDTSSADAAYESANTSSSE